MTLDLGRFEALTFDCYGTLIDWEAGLSAAFRPVLDAHGIDADAEDVLTRYARHEAAAEGGPYRTYVEVLAAGLRGVGDELGFDPDADEVRAFSRSVEDWPAFPDSTEALRRLQRRLPGRHDVLDDRHPLRRVQVEAAPQLHPAVLPLGEAERHAQRRGRLQIVGEGRAALELEGQAHAALRRGHGGLPQRQGGPLEILLRERPQQVAGDNQLADPQGGQQF